MKYLILFNILILSLKGEFLNENYYNISNLNLKILKLDDENFLLYGDNGGVLKSIDAGNNWKQSYSGTNSSILKLIQKDNYIYGLNSDKKIMISKNFGDSWSFIPINTTQGIIVDFTIVDENFFFLTPHKSLLKTDLEGNVIDSLTLDIQDSLLKIEFYDNSLFLSDYNFKNYKSSIDFIEFNQLNDLNNYTFKLIENRLIFFNRFNIAYFKNNQLLKIENINFDIHNCYPIKDEFILINQLVSKEEINIAKLKLDNTVEILYSGNIPEIGQFYYQMIDFTTIGDELLISNFSKTIIKTSQNKSMLNLISYFPSLDSDFATLFYSKNNFYFIGSNHRVVRTENSGATFVTSYDSLQDTIDGLPQSLRVTDFYLIDSLNGIISIFPNGTKKTSFSTKDGFKSLINLNNDLIRGMRFYYKNENKAFGIKLLQQFDVLKVISADLSMNHFVEITEIDSVNTDNLYLQEFDNYLLGSYEKKYSYNNTSLVLFRTNKNWDSIQILHEIKFFEKKRTFCSALLTIDDRVFFKVSFINESDQKETKTYVLSEDLVSFSEINVNLNELNIPPIQFNYYFRERVYSTDTISIAPLNTNNFNEPILARVSYDPTEKKFKYDSLETISELFEFQSTIFKDVSFFYGGLNNIWLPKEKKTVGINNQLEFGPPQLWTYNPYPNPVKSQTKIKIYSSLLNSINNLQIKLIETGSGKFSKIDYQSINRLNNFQAELTLDLTLFPAGLYILEFDLNGIKDSEIILKIEQ